MADSTEKGEESRACHPHRQNDETLRDTIAVCFVSAAIEAAARRGVASAPLLRQAGWAEDVCARPDARVSATSYRALWRGITVALDDEFFGLDSHPLRTGSIAAIAGGAIHCATVGDALAHVCAMFGFLLDGLRPSVRRDGAKAVLLIAPRGAAEPSRFAHETLLMLLHGLLCWLAGQRIALDLARFGYPRPPHHLEYQAMFSPRLAFGCERTEIIFDSAVLALPVVQTVASLRDFQRGAPESVILKYRSSEGASAALRQRLRALSYGDWPTFETLAVELGTTTATLRRRLAEEGQSIRRIKNQLRRERAIALLSQGDEAITQIAIEAGFAEPGAFHRAFKRWTGEPPRQYRSAVTSD